MRFFFDQLTAQCIIASTVLSRSLLRETGAWGIFFSNKVVKVKVKVLVQRLVVDRGRKQDHCLAIGSSGLYPSMRCSFEYQWLHFIKSLSLIGQTSFSYVLTLYPIYMPFFFIHKI